MSNINISLIVNLFLIVLTLAFLLYYVLKGLKKGLFPTLINFGFIVASLLLSLILTICIMNFAGEWLRSALSNIAVEILIELRQASPSLENYILTLVTALISPLVFVLLFIIIVPLMKIPSSIIIKKVFANKGVNEKPKTAHRIGGLGIGIICVFIMSTAISMPMLTYLNVASDVYTVLKEEEIIFSDEEADALFYQIDQSRMSPFARVYFKTATPLIKLITPVKVEGSNSNLQNEINSLVKLIPKITNLNQLKFDDLSKVDVTPIKELIDELDNSSSIKTILAELLKTGSRKWMSNEQFLSINIKEFVGEELECAVDELLIDFTTTDSQSVCDDLLMLADMFEAVASLYTTFGEMNFNNMSQISTNKFREAIDKIDSNQKLTNVVASVLNEGGKRWLEDRNYLGINIRQAVEDDFKNAINVILTDFKQTDSSCVVEDLRAFVNALDVLSEVYTTIQNIDFNDYRTLDVDKLHAVIDKIEADKKATEVVAIVMWEGGNKWDAYQSFLGVNIKASLPENYEDAFDDNITDFKETNELEVVQDLRNFANVLQAYKYAITISDTTSSFDEMKDNLKDFVEVITPETSDSLQGVITPEMFESTGVGSEDAEIISGILDQAIANIAGMIEGQDKSLEADALSSLIAYTINLQNGGQTAGVSTQEMIGTVLASEAISNAIIEYNLGVTSSIIQITEEQKSELSFALEDFEASATADDLQEIDAIKKLFGIN